MRLLVAILIVLLSSTAFGEESTEEVPTVEAEDVAEASISERFGYHKRGFRYRFTVQRRMKVLHIDVEGPVLNRTNPGLRIVVRF